MDCIKCIVKKGGRKTENKYSDGLQPRNCYVSHLQEMTQDIIKKRY